MPALNIVISPHSSSPGTPGFRGRFGTVDPVGLKVGEQLTECVGVLTDRKAQLQLIEGVFHVVWRQVGQGHQILDK